MDTGSLGYHLEQRDPSLMASLLHPTALEQLLAPLARARVMRIKRGALLVVGKQQTGIRTKELEWFVQEWVATPQSVK